MRPSLSCGRWGCHTKGTSQVRALRKRQAFTKPSVKRRQQVLRAVYKLETYGGEQ